MPYQFVLESVLPSHYTDILCSSESTADHLIEKDNRKIVRRKEERERKRNENVVMMFTPNHSVFLLVCLCVCAFMC